MKKLFILSSSALLATFALSSCQKELDTIEKDNTPKVECSIPFELVASIEAPSTKTTLDPSTWDVSWDNGDIVYAVTEDEEWGAASGSDAEGATIAEYTYSSATNSFTTGSTISNGDHTFNFLYSNGTQKTYHRGAGTSHQLTASQTFDGNNPTGNIKAYDALVGQLEATTPTSLADIEMSHLYSLMKVTLKNKTGAAITASSFQISVKDVNIAGVFNITFGATPSISLKTGGNSTITVTISNGSIANNGTLDLYFVMAPFNSYTGAMQFKLTDSSSKIYQQNNALSGVTFNAGAYYTASFTLKAGASTQSIDLSTDTTTSASTTSLTWSEGSFGMTLDKATSGTAANNYYPGTTGKTYTSTRFYSNQKVTVTPPYGCTIKAIDFAATSVSYANAFAGSTFTNGTAYNYGSVVTIVPTDGTSAVLATVGGTCGFTGVTIYYTGTPDARTSVTLSFANSTINRTAADYAGFAGQTASASPNVDAVKNNLTYSIKSDSNSIVTSVNASTGAVTLNGKKGTAVIKVAFAGDEDYAPASAEYTITVAGQYTLDSSAVTSAHSVSWSYTSGSKSITATDGSSWTAYNTYASVGQKTIQMKSSKSCYILTPVASDNITKLIVDTASNADGTGTGTRALTIKSGDGKTTIATGVSASTLRSGYTISGSYTQLRIEPATDNATYVKSVTIQY